MTRKKKPKCECKGWGIPNIIDYRIEPCPKCGAGSKTSKVSADFRHSQGVGDERNK